VADDRLGCTTARVKTTAPIAVQIALQNKLIELRATYAMLTDDLTGRMPLAYVQLVQILTDTLILFTPIALIPSVGPFGVIIGTAVVTLWYSSIVTLAKLFLDPLNNEMKERGGDPGIGGVQVSTLLQETNLASERWRRISSSLPLAVWRPPPSTEKKAAPSEQLMRRIFFGEQAVSGGADQDRSGNDAANAESAAITGGGGAGGGESGGGGGVRG